MALKNTFSENSFDLFNYISMKSLEYDGLNKPENFLMDFNTN